MEPFEYTRARTLDDVVKTLSVAKRSKIVAGGTNLLDLMDHIDATYRTKQASAAEVAN